MSDKEDYGSISYEIPVDFGDETTAGSSTGTATSLSSSERQERTIPSGISDWIFDSLLGFDTNPLKQDSSSERCRNSATADVRLSMLSNFSAAYNVISISLALLMMDASKLSPQPKDEEFCSSALIFGMIIGQVTFGAVGDVLGRHRAMTVVILLQVVGALSSALSQPVQGYVSIFDVLAFWRFVSGLGCGGVYPLSATLTTESSTNKKDRAKLVALIFSFQGIGYIAVPIVAMVIVLVLGESSSLSWRLLLGFGCLPGLLLMTYRQRPSKTPSKPECVDSKTVRIHQTPQTRAVPVSIVDAILHEPDLIRTLSGTAGCWLLFDVLFYGNTLFQPVVLQGAFGTSNTICKASLDSFLLSCMALPGYFVSVAGVGRQSVRWIQAQGFLVMGALYLIIGTMFDKLSRHGYVLLLVYGMTFFFSNYGPNTTTFMLPSMTFSPSCRSTLNGICAAAGKVGAILGSTLFVAALHHFGQEIVFLSCAVFALVGCLLTWLSVSENVGMEPSNDEEQQELLPLQTKSRVPMRLVYSQPSLVDANPVSG